MSDFIVTIPVEGEIKFAICGVDDSDEAIEQATDDFENHGLQCENICSIKLYEADKTIQVKG